MYWLVPSVLLIIALLGIYVVIWQRVNLHWVKSNGEEVQARITQVTPKKRGDYGLTYTLHAEWQRPTDGKLFAYKVGEWLRKDPTGYLAAQGTTHVPVRIDPKYPKAHWIDLDFLPKEFFVKRGNFTI